MENRSNLKVCKDNFSYISIYPNWRSGTFLKTNWNIESKTISIEIMQSEEQQGKKNEEMRKMNRAFEKYGKLLSTNIHVIEVTEYK